MASIFTRIVNGEIPAYKVAEDDNFLAFLDVFPTAKGHTLVVPKKEVDYLFDLDDEMYAGLQMFAKKVALGIQKAIPCVKVGVMVLGLEVPHAHIHLVPMQSEKDLLHFSEKVKFPPEEMEAIAKLIADSIE
ncbi:HIT family protein [Maribellus luteus]|uniref:HIT family protein n=1 Tax=Maribellus luteus TaxID=2305463 RepID=A0A399T081_9BACT|nr:HIT family protein [Maribellus luteus]RIJ49830.1 HIT family protein [Maribellus luteus]